LPPTFAYSVSFIQVNVAVVPAADLPGFRIEHRTDDRIAAYLVAYVKGDALNVAQDLDAQIEKILLAAAK